MTHEDAGNYAKKRHGVELDEAIAGKIRGNISDNRISCAAAHSIAAELNVNPADVGTAIDLLEARIIKCQLGLFGHAKGKNINILSEKINPDIESAIKSSLVNGRLACFSAWEISKRFNASKSLISSACEEMKIKISPCQLGAFG